MVRVSGNSEGMAAANAALVAAAARVDQALARTSPPARVVAAWQALQSDLADLDPRYGR